MTTPRQDGLVHLGAGSAVAPYEQVREQLATAIATGELVIGARLPTVRALAAELGVAVNTVARAYRELEAAGLIETAGRAGSVVSAGGDRRRERLRRAAQDFAAAARAAGLADAEALELVRAAQRRP